MSEYFSTEELKKKFGLTSYQSDYSFPVKHAAHPPTECSWLCTAETTPLSSPLEKFTNPTFFSIFLSTFYQFTITKIVSSFPVLSPDL